MECESTAAAGEEGEGVIDEPRQDGWKTSAETKDLEETSTRLRYKIAALKGKTTKATLTREHVDYQTVSLISLAPDSLLATITGLQNETPALREAIARLGALVAD